MSLFRRYQTGKSCLSKYKKSNDSSSSSSIQKIFVNSLHNPVLDPIDMPSHPFYKNSEQYAKLANASTVKKFSQSNSSLPKQSNSPKQITANPQPQMKNDPIQIANDKLYNPICDIGISQRRIYSNFNNETFSYNKSNRHDIDLPILEKLPPVFDSAFSKKDEKKFIDLLQKKFDLVNTQLNFSNPDMDRPAKQIRLSTIYEICQTFTGKNQNFQVQLNPNKHTRIFKLIFTFLSNLIFRPTIPTFPKFLFSDDISLIVDPELGQISHCYNALRTVLIESTLSQKIKNEIFDKVFIQNLFHRFNAPDGDERSILAQFVLDILNYCTNDNLSFVMNLCYYEISLYLQSSDKPPYVLMPSLSVLYNIYLKRVKSLYVYYHDFIHYVLPVLTANHLVMCSEQIMSIIELFVKNGNNEISLTITKSIVQYFPYTRTNKAVILLNLLLKILPVLKQPALNQFMNDIFEIISKCLTSPFGKINDMAKCIWLNDTVNMMLTQNTNLLFPLILPILHNDSHRGLTNEVQSNIEKVLNLLKRIDENLFNQYDTIDTEKKSNQDQNSLNAWIQIMKVASQNDYSIDISKTISLVDKEFKAVE